METNNNIDFGKVFKRALEQGYIRFDMGNFQGWLNSCDCESCLTQRVICDYLWPEHELLKDTQSAVVNRAAKWCIVDYESNDICLRLFRHIDDITGEDVWLACQEEEDARQHWENYNEMQYGPCQFIGQH